MCGINGIFAYHPDSDLIDEHELNLIRDCMKKRGPDDFGTWVSADRKVGLAHRRLSIIDLSKSAHQPMSLDNDLFIVFNGEIYNYKDLRADLISKGAVFNSSSDTEVLLHLYRFYGKDMVHHLRGMFAFAIWDRVKKTLFLARDPYGIKPLYFLDDGKTISFASQVAALKNSKHFSGQIKPAGIVGFMLWGSVPEPYSCYNSIYSLPAGSTMIVTMKGVEKPEHYWRMTDQLVESIELARNIPAGSEQDYFDHAISESIKYHMVSDVPVGAFLSAGSDSSTIVSFANQFGAGALKTLTLSFDEFSGKPIDEAPLAKEIARYLKVENTCIYTSLDDLERELPVFLEDMDQPTIDGLNAWLVSRAAHKEGLKVALSGLGGDELLGGYSTFTTVPAHTLRNQKNKFHALFGNFKISLISHIPASYRRFNDKTAGLMKYGSNIENAYMLEKGIFMPWELTQIMDTDLVKQGLNDLFEHDWIFNKKNKSGLNDFAQVMTLESKRYMGNQLLRDSDWASMSHSLEVRTPLVDSVLFKQVAGLASLGRLGNNKKALHNSLQTQLPETILRRPKTGFTLPIWKWLRHSDALSGWKTFKPLHQKSVHDYCRWSYCIAKTIPGLQDYFKK